MKTEPAINRQSRYFLVFNMIWFQIIWILAVVYQMDYMYLVLGLIILHFCITSAKGIDGAVMMAGVLLGSIIDGSLTLSEVFVFESEHTLGVLPIWLVVLWGAFALSTYYSLSVLIKRRSIQVALGAIAGPMSYVAGLHFDAVSFSYSITTTSIILAVIWAFLLPTLIEVSHYYRRVSIRTG
ncbi:DUF2878 domain-containing protein [Alteromonas sp. ASW11-130]|uniref:DUF2878 domain-containing protein n=1 Tax=Alteromonas sp. ASW11-130 TaxID=3015775 RepID=UPI0022420D1A|nr:DUF2878 domain-containing protein [Alteromonas sp. ASW11-130]MCW8092138.1 DUF2878 domain-containing protein [Alteromonas sp. ASW11-130]